MEFKIKRISNYLDVRVQDNNTVIDLGLLNNDERVELIRVLAEAILELSELSK